MFNNNDYAYKNRPNKWTPWITKYPECTYDWCKV